MKNVRIWYTKDGACRFISHLDIVRAMTRALQMSGVPLWHTEGFNSRLYVSFAFPLSLGFRGLYESMDVKLLEDDYPFSEIIDRLNSCLPVGIKAVGVDEQYMNPRVISFADFKIKLTAENHSVDEVFSAVNSVMEQSEILVEKKSKKGVVKQVDLKRSIQSCSVVKNKDYVKLSVTLPAGSVDNVNPTLFIDEIQRQCGYEIFADITRCRLYNDKMELFR